MTDVVLDTSALLAFVNGERGSDVVADLIANARMSTVNLAEAVGKLVSTGHTRETALSAIGMASFEIVDFDRALAERCGELIAETRQFGLSLGDRACLALAEREQLPVLTADRDWARLRLGIDVQLIR